MENKSKNKWIIILLILVVIAIGISAFSVWKLSKIQEELSEQSQEEEAKPEPKPEADGTGGPEPEPEIEPEPEPEPEPKIKTSINIKNSKNNPSFDTSKQAYYVTGEISPDCNEIYVDASNNGRIIDSNFKLKEYEAGDEEFVYRMKESFGNLQNGNNLYTFTAFCDDGKTVRTDFEFSFQRAYMDIIDPDNRPEYDFTRDAFTIGGNISSNCNEIFVTAAHEGKIIDSNYKLKEFRAGDREFTYRMHEDYGNLLPGRNTYTFTAYCDNNQVIKLIYPFAFMVDYFPPGFEE